MIAPNGGIAFTPARAKLQRGFTLIELLVTISIGTILMMVAAPSFIAYQRNAALSDAVSEFVAAANSARANSLKQSRNTRLVPKSGVDWSTGWRVYADVNFDNAYTAGTDELVLESPEVDKRITITTPGASTLKDGYLLFNGAGYSKSNAGGIAMGTILMTNAARTSTVFIDGAGRVRSCKTGSAGC